MAQAVPETMAVSGGSRPEAPVMPPPAPPAPPARDTIEDVQLRGLSRWSPRRAGVPSLLDWWPAYFLVGVLSILVMLVTARIVIESLAPFGHVLVVASVATVLTFALAPLVGRLEQYMPRRAAAAVVFFGTLLTILAAAGLVVVQVATEGERFSTQIGDLTATFEGRRQLAIGSYVLPTAVQDGIRDFVLGQAPSVAQHTAAFVLALISSLIDLVLVLVVTFYLLLDARRLRVSLLRTLGPERRPAVQRVVHEVARVFGAYVRAQLTVAISVGVLVALAMSAIGVPYAMFLGLFASLAELIPMLGPIVGAIPALLVTLSLPFPAVIWVALAFLVIQQIEQNVLLPRLSAQAVGIHPIASILALVAGFEVGGIIGALFAVPITGLVWVLVSTTVNAWRGKRQELQRRLEGRAVGWASGRPQARTERVLRHLRPR
jgi:predicted PurR-regulated permease PerM